MPQKSRMRDCNLSRPLAKVDVVAEVVAETSAPKMHLPASCKLVVEVIFLLCTLYILLFCLSVENMCECYHDDKYCYETEPIQGYCSLTQDASNFHKRAFLVFVLVSVCKLVFFFYRPRLSLRSFCASASTARAVGVIATSVVAFGIFTYYSVHTQSRWSVGDNHGILVGLLGLYRLLYFGVTLGQCLYAVCQRLLSK